MSARTSKSRAKRSVSKPKRSTSKPKRTTSKPKPAKRSSKPKKRSVSKEKPKIAKPRRRSTSAVARRRKHLPARSVYSPPLIIQSYAVPKRGTPFNIRVVRDDLLQGGTKGRGLVPLLAGIPEREAVMPAANSGLGQVALAVAAGMLGKIGTVFVAQRAKETKATQLARALGGNVKTVHPGYMTVKKKRALDYTAKRNAAQPGSTRLFALGVDDPAFEAALLSELRAAVPRGFRKPQRVWIAVGSGLLMRVLGALWPDAQLLGVQVGMRQPLSQILGPERAKRARLFTEDTLTFDQPTRDLPPWPAMPSYDAKLWKFIKRYGKEGDLVWNVGVDYQI